MCQLFLRACSPALRCRRRRRKERESRKRRFLFIAFFKTRGRRRVLLFKSMLFFWPFFFWSFLLRSCTFVDDEREPQKKTFCGVDLFILIYIFFHRFVSANHAKRKNRARTNLSPLFFFYARRRRRRRAFFLLRGVDVDRGRRGEFSNEFRRRRRRRSRNKNDDEEKISQSARDI